MKKAPVTYIGNRTNFSDDLYNTGCVWSGYGSVQYVDESQAAFFKRHPDSFVVGQAKPTDLAGKEAAAAALGISIGPSGELILNVVPRTNTLAGLLAVAGNPGEVASATDQPALVKFTGEAGKAQVIASYGTTGIDTVTADGAYTVPSMYSVFRLYGDTTDGAVALTVGIAPGYVDGQRIKVEILATGSNALTLAIGSNIFATTPLTINTEHEFMWDGAAWNLIATRQVAGLGPGAESIAGGIASGAGIAIGHGSSTLDYGQVAVSGEAIVNCHNKYDAAYQAGRKTYKLLNDLQLTTTATTANQELTADGALAGSTNRFAFPAGEPAVARMRVTVQGRIGTSGNNVWSNTFDLVVSIANTGAVVLIGAVVAGTAISAGTLNTSPPTVSVGIASNKLQMLVTPGVATSTTWTASVDCVKQVM